VLPRWQVKFNLTASNMQLKLTCNMYFAALFATHFADLGKAIFRSDNKLWACLEEGENGEYRQTQDLWKLLEALFYHRHFACSSTLCMGNALKMVYLFCSYFYAPYISYGIFNYFNGFRTNSNCNCNSCLIAIIYLAKITIPWRRGNLLRGFGN